MLRQMPAFANHAEDHKFQRIAGDFLEANLWQSHRLIYLWACAPNLSWSLTEERIDGIP